MKIILKIKNLLFNNKNLNHLIVLIVIEITGKNLIRLLLQNLRIYYQQAKTSKLIKKILKHNRDFPTRLNYAKTKIREIYIDMVNTKYNSTQDMIIKLQQLKGKTKLKIYENINNFNNEMKDKNFQTNQEDRFSKNAQGTSKIYHEVLLLMKLLRTKPQVQNMNINYYDSCFTVLRTRDKNKDIDIQYEKDDNDFLTPNRYIGIKPRETLLN